MSQTDQFSPRPAFLVQCDVIYALFLREIKTRFGEYKMGYFWAFFEPMVHTIILVMIHSARGSAAKILRLPTGVDIPVFFLTGIVPFFMFKNIISHMMRSVSANRGLFFFRQVKPMDDMIARTLLEVVLYLVVYCVLLVAAGLLGYHVGIYDPLGLIAVLAVLILFSFGLAIIICIASTFIKEVEQVFLLLLLPLYAISAVFFPAASVPPQYQYLLTWNPMLHFQELIRTSYFQNFNTRVGSIEYVLVFTIGFLFIGLSLYHLTKKRLVASS